MSQKVAICCSAPGGLSAVFDSRFGRCQGFTVVNLADGKIIQLEYVENGAQNAMGGAGIQAAQTIGNLKVTDLIVGFMGPNAAGALKNVPNLKIYTAQNEKVNTVKDALDLFLANKLPPVTDANAAPHSGMRGGGGGRGF